jgi:inhibitor of KinA sporulation pathway (predicted exonuclease)
MKAGFIANAWDELAAKGLRPLATTGFTMTQHEDGHISASMFVTLVDAGLVEEIEVELPESFQTKVRAGMSLGRNT